jgi:hypothetical protein
VVVEVTAAPIDLTPPEPEPAGLFAQLYVLIAVPEIGDAATRTTETTEEDPCPTY